MSIHRWMLIAWLSVSVFACSDDPDDTIPIDEGRDIAEALSEIEGVISVRELDTSEPGYRFVAIEFEQPVDHTDPDSPVFTQFITLSHRAYAAPMVVASTGYHNYLFDRLSEPAQLLQANQIVIEHRFFSESRPSPPDWTLLTVEQAAADHHRVIEALSPLYPNAWVSTGASKGGMTSVYHRRFYPDDVDATIAYVTPISFAPADERYLPFFDTVGDSAGDSECRQAVRLFQRDALTRRTELLALTSALADMRRYTFDRLGGAEAALEVAITDFEWGFWQYLGALYCDIIPTPASTDTEVFDFLGLISAVDLVSDRTIELFEPYYYQAEAELGYPAASTAHIDDLLLHEPDLSALMPDGVTPMHDPQTMADMADWVLDDASEILFVYGEFDPWTAGAFDIGRNPDINLATAPLENHGALISDLANEDFQAALNLIETWTGATVTDTSAARLAPRPIALRPPPVLRARR